MSNGSERIIPGDVTGPRWVGGVNAPASGEGGRRPVSIPEDEMKRVYSRGYEEAFAAKPLGDRGVWITGGVRAVAEWAQKEALREAAAAIENLPGSVATGYYASEQHSGYQDAQNDADAAIRALSEGVSDGQQ